MATALAISALPVITKILMDLNLKTDLGVTIIGRRIFNDLTGWMIFAIVLSLMGDTSGGFPWGTIVGIIVGTFMLTLGRKMILALIPRVQASVALGREVLWVFMLTGALLALGVAELIGVHDGSFWRSFGR